MKTTTEPPTLSFTSLLLFGAVNIPTPKKCVIEKKSPISIQKEFDNDGAYITAEGDTIHGIGLQYYGARYLDNKIGMWTSLDPAEQFWSGYSYMGNGYNSISASDPDGETALAVIGTMGKGGLEAAALDYGLQVTINALDPSGPEGWAIFTDNIKGKQIGASFAAGAVGAGVLVGLKNVYIANRSWRIIKIAIASSSASLTSQYIMTGDVSYATTLQDIAPSMLFAGLQSHYELSAIKAERSTGGYSGIASSLYSRATSVGVIAPAASQISSKALSLGADYLSKQWENLADEE